MTNFTISRVTSLGEKILNSMNKYIEGETKYNPQTENVSMNLTPALLTLVDLDRGTTDRTQYILDVIARNLKLLDKSRIKIPLTFSRSELFRVFVILDKILAKYSPHLKKQKKKKKSKKQDTPSSDPLKEYLKELEQKIIGVA